MFSCAPLRTASRRVSAPPLCRPPQFDGDEAYLEEDESITRMDNGRYTIKCINKHSAEDNAQRDAYTLTVASINTLVIAGMCIWGYYEFQAVQRTYEPGKLLAWYS